MASKILAEELQSGSYSLSTNESNGGTDIGDIEEFDNTSAYSANDKVKYRPNTSTAYSVYKINYDMPANKLPANAPEADEWTGASTYDASSAYSAGDKVNYLGRGYMAHADHDASNHNISNAAHWGLASAMFTNITLRIDGFNDGDIADTRTIESLNVRIANEESADGVAKEVFSTEDGFATNKSSIDVRVALEKTTRESEVSSTDDDVAAEKTARESAVSSTDDDVESVTTNRGSKVTSVDNRWSSEVSTWNSALSEEEGTMTYIEGIPLTKADSSPSNGTTLGSGDDDYSINADGNVVTITYPSRTFGVDPTSLTAFDNEGTYVKGDQVSYDSKSWQALSDHDGSQGTTLDNPGATAGEWENITNKTVPAAVASLRMTAAGHAAGAPMLMCMGQGTPTATQASFVLSAAPENDLHYVMDVAIAM
ncbi:MAG: hypothetical protein CMO74_14425 [Verrucomicrobiales bacterium]|nr:hypothetical protein [Verrucomicrobiales bacterium]|tara:strand:- start:67831 stop:69108 length:1278 start_codon:yes stop_codon:yes gene_type:complete